MKKYYVVVDCGNLGKTEIVSIFGVIGLIFKHTGHGKVTVSEFD